MEWYVMRSPSRGPVIPRRFERSKAPSRCARGLHGSVTNPATSGYRGCLTRWQFARRARRPSSSRIAESEPRLPVRRFSFSRRTS